MQASTGPYRPPHVPVVYASDHLLILISIRLRQEQSGRENKVLLPTPHRINAEAVQASAIKYNAQLPRLEAKLRACGVKVRFDVHFVKVQEMIRKP